MNAWGLLILLAGLFLVFMGITGRAGAALNGVRTRTGNPPKAY